MLRKYFFESQQIFGGISSVGNYDILGHTVEDLAVVISDTPAELTLCRLDDVPNVSSVSNNGCERFTEVYSETCDDINVKLAPDCPNRDKAFRNEKEGKVLGIIFHILFFGSILVPARREKVKMLECNCIASCR